MTETRVAHAVPCAAGAPAPAPAARRPREWPLVDALRGLCLVFMAVAHLGGPLAPYFWQPLGFVSVAEVFFFLSGFVAGASCTRQAQRACGDTSAWDAGRRVRRVYKAHAATVLIGGGGLLVLANVLNRGWSALRDAWPALVDAPVRALAMSSAMLAVHSPLDILPLYVIFLMSVPIVVRQCHAGRWPQVAAVSLAVWGVSQLTRGRLLHWASRLVPGLDPPDFDLFGYQLAFVAGVLIGWDVVTRGHAGRLRLRPPRIAAVVGAAAILLVLRRVAADESLLNQLLASRPSFGPVRALNFALLMLLAVNARAWLARWLLRGPLPMLGRQSLYVFSAHAVLVLWLRPWRADLARLGPSVEVAATAALLAAMAAVAWWRERWRDASSGPSIAPRERDPSRLSTTSATSPPSSPA